VGKLAATLRPLGIEPVLTIKEIDQEAFQANPSESNRIWIGDRPFEEWLGSPAAAVLLFVATHSVARSRSKTQYLRLSHRNS
jgi:uncharacterized protein DUF2703